MERRNKIIAERLNIIRNTVINSDKREVQLVWSHVVDSNCIISGTLIQHQKLIKQNEIKPPSYHHPTSNPNNSEGLSVVRVFASIFASFMVFTKEKFYVLQCLMMIHYFRFRSQFLKQQTFPSHPHLMRALKRR